MSPILSERKVIRSRLCCMQTIPYTLIDSDLDARQTLVVITEALIRLDVYHKHVSFFKDSSSMQGPTERK
jgi:hypothetical protein